MTVQHHLDQTTIVRFASGDMDEAFAVVVAAHLDMCPTCRRAVEDAEAIGGQVLEDTGIEAMSDGSFDALLDKLDSATKTAVNPHYAFRRFRKRRAQTLTPLYRQFAG